MTESRGTLDTICSYDDGQILVERVHYRSYRVVLVYNDRHVTIGRHRERYRAVEQAVTLAQNPEPDPA